MSIALPRWFRAALLAPSTDEGLIVLVRVENAAYPAPLLLTSHAQEIFSFGPPMVQGVTHLGEQYIHALASVEEPDDIEGEEPDGRVVLPTKDMRFPIDVQRIVSDESTDSVVTMKHVAKSAPDQVLTLFPSFVITGATGVRETIAFDFGIDTASLEPIPQERITPETCPGLFR